jgi:hypothetical protein
VTTRRFVKIFCSRRILVVPYEWSSREKADGRVSEVTFYDVCFRCGAHASGRCVARTRKCATQRAVSEMRRTVELGSVIVV